MESRTAYPYGPLPTKFGHLSGSGSGSGSSQRLQPAQDAQQRIDVDVTVDNDASSVRAQHLHATATHYRNQWSQNGRRHVRCDHCGREALDPIAAKTARQRYSCKRETSCFSAVAETWRPSPEKASSRILNLASAVKRRRPVSMISIRFTVVRKLSLCLSIATKRQTHLNRSRRRSSDAYAEGTSLLRRPPRSVLLLPVVCGGTNCRG